MCDESIFDNIQKLHFIEVTLYDKNLIETSKKIGTIYQYIKDNNIVVFKYYILFHNKNTLILVKCIKILHLKMF